MLYSVEGLFEIELKDDDLPSRLMALMDILKTPTYAVLNGAALNKSILVLMNELHDVLL